MKRYAVWFIVAALAAGLTTSIAVWGSNVLGCPYPQDGDEYLAYCTSEQYGDFEHGAYYFAMEPVAVGNLLAAEVVFLGSSRVQFGFSTDAVREFFARRKIDYHILGFGYADGHRFAQALLARLGARPKFFVIVADPFFSNFLSEPARALLGDRDESSWTNEILFARTYLRYRLKLAFNTMQPEICRRLSSLCQAHWKSIFRARSDGAWNTVNFVDHSFPGYPVTDRKIVQLDHNPPPGDVEGALAFFKATGISRKCAVLTVAPNNAIDAEPYAKAMGELIGVSVLLPRMAGMMTADASHLTRASAERWSAEILRLAEPAMAACLNGGTG
jgi:hypothetical protein